MHSESLALNQSEAREESESDVLAPRRPGGPSKVWYATLSLLAVAGLGGVVALAFTPSTPNLSDVDSLVRLSGWNTYIEPILEHAEGNCDRAAIVGMDGSKWTSNDHPAALKLTPEEAEALATAVENDDVNAYDKLTFEGVRYVFVRSIQESMFVSVKKEHGGITFRKTKMAIVVAHTKEGGSQGSTNIAVEMVASHFSDHGMRRRLSGDQDLAEAVVLEVAGTMKAGFAGEDQPQSSQENNPVGRDGMVSNWDDEEKLLHFALYNALETDPSERPVLLTETSLNPVSNREKLTQMMFETFESPAMYLANNAVLAAYAAGKKTAVVLYMDEHFSQAVPVYEGHAIDYATRVHQEESGVHETVFDSIMACPVDIREDFYANIILAGPGSLLPGIADRLQKGVSDLAPPTMKIKVIAPPGRDDAVWIGGSIFASVSTFKDYWISKEEYATNGPTVVHYKCF